MSEPASSTVPKLARSWAELMNCGPPVSGRVTRVPSGSRSWAEVVELTTTVVPSLAIRVDQSGRFASVAPVAVDSRNHFESIAPGAAKRSTKVFFETPCGEWFAGVVSNVFPLGSRITPTSLGSIVQLEYPVAWS